MASSTLYMCTCLKDKNWWFCIKETLVWDILILIYTSCRFWSRFLPTLKRFTVLELKATLRGIAMISSFLVSTHSCDLLWPLMCMDLTKKKLWMFILYNGKLLREKFHKFHSLKATCESFHQNFGHAIPTYTTCLAFLSLWNTHFRLTHESFLPQKFLLWILYTFLILSCSLLMT